MIKINSINKCQCDICPAPVNGVKLVNSRIRQKTYQNSIMYLKSHLHHMYICSSTKTLKHDFHYWINIS